MIGQSIGNYRVIAKLSEGGMGAVFRAEHALIGKAAAIKVLLPEMSQRREIVERFFNEAKATSAIRHPGIVEIFDFGYDASGQAYIVMEFLSGETLAARLRTHGKLPPAVAVTILRSVASAVGAAHAMGIVHRDLKPDNVFLVPDPDMPSGERSKVLDFGIAKLSDGGAMSRTRTGAVMGTPTYMAPEQCRGAGSVDLRADIYALGCILFELVVGMPPFVAEGFGEIIAAHMMTPAPSPRQFDPSISVELEALILRCLAKQPEQRFASMESLVAALDATGLGRRSEPMSWAAPNAMRVATGGAHGHAGAPGVGSAPGLTRVPARSTVLLTPSTTLGGAAAEATSSRAASAGRGKPLAIAAVVLVAAAGIGFALTRGEEARGPRSPQAANPWPPQAAGPTTTPEGRPVEPTISAPLVDAAPAATTVSITLELTPPDAQVLLDGRPVTDNPIVVPRSERTHIVEVRAPDHISLTRELGANVDSHVTVALAKEVTRVEDSGGTRPRPARKPKTPRAQVGSGSTGPFEDDI